MAFTIDQQIAMLNDSIFEASRYMQRDFSELVQLQSSSRGVQDYTNKAYSRLQNKLTSILTEKRPKYGLITGNEAIDEDKEYSFILEPISGFSNFCHNIPFCSIAIALVDHNKMPVAISLHNPILRETFYAGKAAGSWFENYAETVGTKSRMRVSKQASFTDAFIASSLDHFPLKRNLGDDLLELAYMASGRFDLVVSKNKNSLTKSAFLFVTEAGGHIVENNNYFIATNDALHKRAPDILAEL